MSREILQKQIEQLRGYSTLDTSMISVYIPSGHHQINDMLSKLKSEMSDASSIKSKSTSKAVKQALKILIKQIQSKRNGFPSTGLAFFAGKSAKGKVDCIVVEPIGAVRKLYRCDKRFYLNPLDAQLCSDKPAIGVVVFDTANLVLGEIKGEAAKILFSKTFRVPKRHKKGGQSAPRFQRQRI